MVEDKDIFATATLMIDQYGSGAWIECAVAEGDEEAMRLGSRSADAVAKMDDMEASGQVH